MLSRLSRIEIAMHLIFWFTFRPFMMYLEDEWFRNQDDPYVIFERAYFQGFAAIGASYWIYLPPVLLVLCVGLVCRWRKVREPSLCQVMGPAFGILALVYWSYLRVSYA
jgi:hypothetical protein